MRLKKAVFAGTVGLLAAALPLAAHHSFAAEYDSSQVVTLKGTITQVDWTNPHIYLHIDVKDANGTSKTGLSKATRLTRSSAPEFPGTL